MRSLLGRQKLLLAVIHSLQARSAYGRTSLVKVLFLLSREYDLGGLKPYSFFPYHFGPFSNLAFSDLAFLSREGYVDEVTRLTGKALPVVASLNPTVRQAVGVCVSRFSSAKELLSFVYSNYPAYTVRSKLARRVAQMKARGVLLIGYEGRDIDAFLDQLVQNDVTLLVDVRNNPFSMNFSFVKSKLKGYLQKAGIGYLHLPELGVESEKRKHLQTPADYGELFEGYARTTLVQNPEAVERVATLASAQRVALMCFERDSDRCHRGVLADALRERGVAVSEP